MNVTMDVTGAGTLRGGIGDVFNAHTPEKSRDSIFSRIKRAIGSAAVKYNTVLVTSGGLVGASAATLYPYFFEDLASKYPVSPTAAGVLGVGLAVSGLLASWTKKQIKNYNELRAKAAKSDKISENNAKFNHDMPSDYKASKPIETDGYKPTDESNNTAPSGITADKKLFRKDTIEETTPNGGKIWYNENCDDYNHIGLYKNENKVRIGSYACSNALGVHLGEALNGESNKFTVVSKIEKNKRSYYYIDLTRDGSTRPVRVKGDWYYEWKFSDGSVKKFKSQRLIVTDEFYESKGEYGYKYLADGKYSDRKENKWAGNLERYSDMSIDRKRAARVVINDFLKSRMSGKKFASAEEQSQFERKSLARFIANPRNAEKWDARREAAQYLKMLDSMSETDQAAA